MGYVERTGGRPISGSSGNGFIRTGESMKRDPMSSDCPGSGEALGQAGTHADLDATI
jgi:hypothetical protein